VRATRRGRICIRQRAIDLTTVSTGRMAGRHEVEKPIRRVSFPGHCIDSLHLT
jgi:hypothetical protein